MDPLRLDVHVYFHPPDQDQGQLDRMEQKLDAMIQKEDHMAGELEALQAQVAETVGVEQSAIALIQGLKAKLDQAIAAGNMALVQDLRNQLDASETALATAVAENPVPPAAEAPPA